MRIHKLLLALLMIGTLLLAACGTAPTAPTDGTQTSPAASPATSPEASPEASPAATEGETPAAIDEDAFSAAFVYVGPIGDVGWTYAHDQGRLQLEENIPGLQTAYQENVPENAADAERVIRDFAQRGYDIIFTTSFGYMDPTITVAQDFPDTKFVHVSGYKIAPNVSTVFGKIEEPRYVSGLIAGNMTESNVLGYVAAFPIPEVIRGINAFTLGVREVNPEATVRVVWTNTWYNPQVERQAAEALLDEGADVIAQHQDTPGPVQAAEARGKYAVGYNADMSQFGPNAFLTSPIWHWDVPYTQMVRAAQDGTWESEQYWGGWQDGVVDLAPIGPSVPDDVREAAEAEIERFRSGEQTVFTVFTGPLNDQTGTERVADGQAMTGEEILSMNWFVEGVEGTIPQ